MAIFTCCFASAAMFTLAGATSLASLCTTSYVNASFGSSAALQGLEVVSDSISVSALYNQTVGGGGSMRKRQASSSGGSDETFSYCSVNLTYQHSGGKDPIKVIYALPEPSTFENRFYVAGGGGYSLSSSATGGLEYGAAGGATDAGYGSLDGTAYDDVVLIKNGTINWEATRMFGYEALGEMAIVGKALTRGFYNTTKLYTYFEGCSDGGREGMSQVQRWPEEYDGVIAGAPAFRYAQQQVNHVFSSAVEHTLDYYPCPCALEKIVNVTIEKCDPLDGKTDGVVSRTDLCKLHFNLSSIIGQDYYCAAQNATSLGFGSSGGGGPSSGSQTSYQPAQNGSVTSADVAVAQAIYNGLHELNGKQAYLSWQIGSQLGDATTQWSNSSNAWELDIPSTGGEFVAKFVELRNASNLSNLDGVTYDSLVHWMKVALNRYNTTLQTTYPDLSRFKQHGGKLLHYHGESDPSIPSASSVYYWQSVREVMYGVPRSNASSNPLADWYQLYLVPGAAHCGSNNLQPEGPYPEDNMQIMIDWVEDGVQPKTLNATASENVDESTWELCQWPLRPVWKSNSSSAAFECENDDVGYESWVYDFEAFEVPIW